MCISPAVFFMCAAAIRRDEMHHIHPRLSLGYFFPLCSLLACPGFWLVFGLSYFGFTLLYFILFHFIMFLFRALALLSGWVVSSISPSYCLFHFLFYFYLCFYLFSYFVFVFCFCFCFCLFRISLFQCISVADVCMFVVPVVPSTRA